MLHACQHFPWPVPFRVCTVWGFAPFYPSFFSSIAAVARNLRSQHLAVPVVRRAPALARATP